MTDRIHAFTVVLDKDIREDDVEIVTNAIRMIRHVIDVREHVADLDSHVAAMRVRSELYPKILELLKQTLLR